MEKHHDDGVKALMRRKEKAVEHRREQETIISRARVCRLGMCDGGKPYVVPLCFGYRDGRVYLHSARNGRKIDILKRNNHVCVEFDLDGALEVKANPCNWGMHFQSVIAFGTARFLETESEKKTGLDLILAHYNAPKAAYARKTLAATTVIEITIEEMTAKRG